MKLAICTNFVSPYRRPVFEAIARQTGADVRVFTSTDMEGDRAWNAGAPAGASFGVTRSWSLHQTRTTRDDSGFRQRLERHIPVGLPLDLAVFGPDAVISGELGPRTAIAMGVGRALGVPVIPWTYHARAQFPEVSRTSGMRRRLLDMAPAVIGMGTQARDVLSSLGCDESKIFDAPNAADASTIRQRIASAEPARGVATIRDRFGGKKIALVVGRLVEMKGIAPLLEGWRRIASGVRDDWRLVFVGHGPLDGLVDRAEHHGVVGIGHVDPESLADWYAAADLHVFASLGDPWGLVVNEAMQCGTPTLCSSLAGCADDLIDHGRNGLLFDPSAGPEAVAHHLTAALHHPGLTALGRAARRDVSGFTPESMARGMVAALDAVAPSLAVNS